MPNINKVVYGNTTLIDLTDTTAEAADVAQGKYFYGKDGVKTQGTGSGGGGTLSPILNSSVTIGGSNAGSIEITLPKTVTNCIISVQADSTTFSAMYDDTNSGYNFLSGVFLYPFPSYQNGESTIYTCRALNRYRTSYKTSNYYYISNITISGTTLTVSVDLTCRFRANGTYLVKVWEVALT